MSDRTFLRHDGWEPDEIEDYRNLKTDDERRRMFCTDGFDEAHRSEAVRLFPEQFEQPAEECVPEQQTPNGQQCIDGKLRPRKPLKISKFGKWLIGAVGLLGVFIGILANWDQAIEKFWELFSALFP